MKLAFVIQRYGADVAGGAEQHCRQVVERLSGDFDIEVLTTTARDYVRWVGTDDYAPGRDEVGGVAVRRFPVERPRRPTRFVWQTRAIHRLPHSLRQEERWIEAQGPYVPALLEAIRERRDEFDAFVFYSYRYHPCYFGAAIAPEKSVVVPTAERDWTVGTKAFRRFFSRVRGFLFMTQEERDLIRSVADIDGAMSEVVGLGVDAPPDGPAGRFGKRHPECAAPYALYLGRVDRNKGCDRLFEYATRFFDERSKTTLRLVLAGAEAMPIPRHSRIASLGFVSEEEKFDALRDCAFLVMPSPYESLSMVTLEAMAMGRPVLANGACDVLAGHCRRSGAGLTYNDYESFAAGVEALLADEARRREMGEAGQRYIAENYAWPVVLRKCSDFLRSFVAG